VANVAANVADGRKIDVCLMKDWAERGGEVLMGAGIEPKAPEFDHGAAGSDGWVSFEKSGVCVDEQFVPARAMVVNIPIECFTTDASKFKDWTTPGNNAIRAASIAALVGLFSTPLSKGWPYARLCHSRTAPLNRRPLFTFFSHAQVW